MIDDFEEEDELEAGVLDDEEDEDEAAPEGTLGEDDLGIPGEEPEIPAGFHEEETDL